ncbi:guanine nucleotide-binding protein-like 1, partial [Pyrgilauda ruficollis]|uniref:guanine nucleotide-binding protein-like 1 n=1 Tax=Pyrgilauda ruficollis TaxID=221976 RepID=UPI001B87530E
LQKRQKKRGGRWGRAVGPRLLLEACQEIVGGAVDLSSWRARLERAEQRPEDEEDEEEEEEEEPPRGDEDEEEEGAGPGGVAPPRQWERYRHGVLTLGCVGLPNAGKSSVLNALLGRGAVAVSRCPGRTRYFQTHFLTGSVRLCDCPGLVFPSRAPPTCRDLLGPARTCRGLPGPARTCRDQPGPAGACQDLPGSARTCRDLPGPAGACWDLPGPARTCRDLPGRSG